MTKRYVERRKRCVKQGKEKLKYHSHARQIGLTGLGNDSFAASLEIDADFEIIQRPLIGQKAMYEIEMQ